MPNYDWVCPKCDQEWECWVALDERHNVVCPECGTPAQRVFTPSYVKLNWLTPTHNKDPFNPLPPGYSPGNIREI